MLGTPLRSLRVFKQHQTATFSSLTSSPSVLQPLWPQGPCCCLCLESSPPTCCALKVGSLAVRVGRAQCEPVFRERVAALDKAPWLGLGMVTAAHRRLGGTGATAGSQGHPAWQLRPCASFYPISSFLQHLGSQNSPAKARATTSSYGAFVLIRRSTPSSGETARPTPGHVAWGA